MQTGDLILIRGVSGGPGVGLDTLTVRIEVMPPADADPMSSARWARATTRILRDENKIPKGATKAGLARLLEAEAEKAVKAGQISRALTASYLEDQLERGASGPSTPSSKPKHVRSIKLL